MTTHRTTTPVGTVVRGGTLALLAIGLLAAGQLGPTAADGAPAAATTPLGTTDLLQGADVGYLAGDLGELNRQITDLYGARTVSACTGGAGFDAVTGDKTLVSLGARWDNRDGVPASRVTEAVAQATSPAAARQAARRTVSALLTCRHRAGAWHYGTLYGAPLTDGGHVWLDRLDAAGRATGGVAVMLQGDRLGVVEVVGSLSDGDDAIKNLVLPAEAELAG